MGYEARMVTGDYYVIEDWENGNALCRISFLPGFYESMIETGLMSENDLQSIADEFMKVLIARMEFKGEKGEKNAKVNN